MAKKTAFIVISQNIDDCGANDPAGEFTLPHNQLQIQPPANMIVTRLTIQVQGYNYATALYYEIIFSNTPMRSAQSGFKLQTFYDVNALAVVPSSFSMENFQDEGMNGTLYVANCTGNVTPICVIYEGYYRD